MSWWRRRGAGWVALGAVLLIGAVPVARDVLRPAEQQVSVEAYDHTDDPRVIVVHLSIHPDFVVRVETDEDDTHAVLHGWTRPPGRAWSGGDHAVPRAVRVRLDRPLAGRQVVDGYSRAPVPER